MCQFISGYIGWDDKIYIGDTKSHSSVEEIHNLSQALKSNKPPVPFEWPRDDCGDSIEIRIPEGVDRDELYYRAILLAYGETRVEFITRMLSVKKWRGSLDLSGCDLSTIDIPDKLRDKIITGR